MHVEAPGYRPVQIIVSLALIIAVGLVAGCASPGTNVDIKQSPTVSLSKYNAIEVEVTTKDLDFKSTELALLTARVVDGLQKSGRFDKVSTNSATVITQAGLKMAVEVQFAVGPNTGHIQSVETAVAVTDASSGETVASANISSHTAWSLLGGKMADAIDSLGDQIVNFATKP